MSEIALSIVNLTKSGIAKTAIVKVITEITPNNALVLYGLMKLKNLFATSPSYD